MTPAAELEQTLQNSALELASKFRADSLNLAEAARTFCTPQIAVFGPFVRSVRGVKNMTDAMETYIATQNIARFKAQLREETHPDKRRILLQLLANEAAMHPEAGERAEMIQTNQLSMT